MVLKYATRAARACLEIGVLVACYSFERYGALLTLAILGAIAYALADVVQGEATEAARIARDRLKEHGLL